MALVRKGARRIVVEGTAYRWRVRHKPSYCQAMGWTPLTFAVEHADAAGSTLVVITDQPHEGSWRGREAKPVLPSAVAHAVRLALREGWMPTSPGRPFRLDRSTGFTPAP